MTHVLTPIHSSPKSDSRLVKAIIASQGQEPQPILPSQAHKLNPSLQPISSLTFSATWEIAQFAHFCHNLASRSRFRFALFATSDLAVTISIGSSSRHTLSVLAGIRHIMAEGACLR